MSADTRKKFMEMVSLMDETEQVHLLWTIEAVNAAKSKGWRTRRLKDFIRWFEKRSKRAPQQPV